MLQGAVREKLQPFKTQGITKVYIMFDGDKAGSDAAFKLKPMIEELDLEAEIIKLEDDVDPGVLSEEYVASIKEYINGKDSNN
jgi:DNA primase